MRRLTYLLLFILIVVAGFFFGKPYYDLHFTGKDLSNVYEVYVPTGSSLEDVGDLLEGKIMSKSEFLSFAQQLDFTDEKVEPGKYELGGSFKNKEIIYALKNGNQEKKDVRITFNNCQTIEEMAGKVAPSIEADSASIVDVINSDATVSDYGFTKNTMMALFLPDTYEVGEWDMSADEFVRFMADQFKLFWNDERMLKLNEKGLKQSEVTILASIIESEQGVFQQEWETIAGLYINRFKSGWKLESDPTAKFCWGDELEGIQRLTHAHMRKDCPYNTYLYAGLPPGPLKIPSKKAIDAVLNAEDHNYYFMCAKPDNSGLHNFAATLSEHNRNAGLFHAYMDSRGL